MSRLPAPAAVLLDLDGTLVDTVGHRISAWPRAFAEAHLPAAGEHVASLIGSDGRCLAHKVARAAGESWSHRLRCTSRRWATRTTVTRIRFSWMTYTTR